MAEKAIHVTPRGVFRFPKLNEPDTKFKEAGEYSVQLVVPQEQAQELITFLTNAHEDWYRRYTAEKKRAKAVPRKKADYPFTFEVDPETGEQTGNVIFRFKMTASGVSKQTGKEWRRRPALFDSKGKPIDPSAVAIWSGSEGKVAYSIYEYESTPQQGVGISLKLEAVQVLKLVTGGNDRNAEEYGFTPEEGGYEEASEELREDYIAEEAVEDSDGDF